MKSPKSNHVFAKVPSVSMPRSAFRRDRTYKTAFDAGYLIPFYLDEVLPGDTFNLGVTAFSRLSTPVVPFMDNLYMDFFFFFVPCRLVWEHWEHFNGYQENPGDSTDFLIPTLDETDGANQFDVGSIGDYFGLPVNKAISHCNVLPFRCYNLIWNEFFRDENLQDSLQVYKGDGPDPRTWNDGGTLRQVYSLRRRGKRKDYFTSCLPSPQKGPGVELPLGGIAPVTNLYATGQTPAQSDRFSPKWYNNQGLPLTGGNIAVTAAGGTGITGSTASSSGSYLALGADLSRVNAVTINTMRQAFQIQRLLERDNLGGTRYFETLVAHFGVRSPDARLQRPEYLGGGSAPIQIHTVAQTSSTDSTSPQGNLAAIGVAGSSQIGFSKSFVEHGYIIGLVEVRADLTYQQGLDRLWSRRSRFEFYWPALAHLGEQAVLNKEISYNADSDDEKVFGYQERWAEYRYGVSKITGKLRSGVTGSLDVWHLSQYFTDRPTLGDTFIRDNPPVSRVLAVQDEPQFIFDSIVSVNCVRPMPVYSVPGLIDHF